MTKLIDWFKCNKLSLNFYKTNCIIFGTKTSNNNHHYFMNDMQLKPLHTIGKVSLNASILYRNQEILNKTNP